MPTETLTLINNPGSYDLGAVNYTTKVVKAINDQFTDPACSGTIEFIIEYCDITTLPFNIPAGTGIQYGSTVNLTTWFNRGANTSIEYTKTINGTTTVINTPTSFTFNQPENTDVVITLRDTQITSPECKASITKTVLGQPKTCKQYYIDVFVSSYTPEQEYLTVSYIPCNAGFGTEADRVTHNISLNNINPYTNTDYTIKRDSTTNPVCILEGSLIISTSSNVTINGPYELSTCSI